MMNLYREVEEPKYKKDSIGKRIKDSWDSNPIRLVALMKKV